ncbi:MAG: SGNH/GDSL hydrolase family protein, partial [Proteobacteria bacterium]|nr:SGNH/GDSL hydrolase family protein [Pseudomonadota bacterium]
EAGRAAKAAEDPIVQYDPELGWRNIPGKKVARMTPFIGAVEINQNGFRASVDYAYPKPPGKFRIAALGDSFTFGMVPNAHTFPAKLEALSQKLEVINMGTCAYGVDQMYLLYRSSAVQFDADLTVLALIGGDLQRVFLYKWLSGHGRPHFSLSRGELVLSNVPVPQRIKPGSQNVHPMDFFQYLRTQYFPPTPDQEQQTVPYRLVEEIYKLAAANKRPFLLLVLPELSDLDADREHRAALRQLAEKHTIPFLDLTEEFRKARNTVGTQTLYLKDKHYTPEGNDIVARRLFEYISQRGLFPSDM